MVNLKCDETCKGGDNCTNSRIYISGLPKGCTADDITDMFGGLGTIARERPQGSGVFPDMMPYRVKFYGNDDCLLHYEDPHAAHAAPSFFDGQELKGSKLHVEMAEKKPNQGLPAGYYIPPEAKGQSYGSGGAGRGGGPTSWQLRPAGGQLRRRRRLRRSAAATTAGGRLRPPRRPPRLRPPRPARRLRPRPVAPVAQPRPRPRPRPPGLRRRPRPRPPVPLAVARPAPRRLLSARARASTPELRRAALYARQVHSNPHTYTIFCGCGAVEPLWLPYIA